MTEFCHHCEYDLMGLPSEGKCPECGELYNKHSSYRVGRTSETVLAGHIKWISLAAFTLIVLCIGSIAAALSDRPWGVVALTLIIASVSGFGAFAYWWAERQDRRGSA
ncbi:MAG: hypothetical protein AB8C95_05045 [Phycisphaeraceae bacterium]